jgi:hypothetical protein
MGISILSYRGHATLAIVADAHLVPDPETITQLFQREFVTLLAAARRAGASTATAGKAALKKPATPRKPAAARKAAAPRA